MIPSKNVKIIFIITDQSPRQIYAFDKEVNSILHINDKPFLLSFHVKTIPPVSKGPFKDPKGKILHQTHTHKKSQNSSH